EYHFLGDAGVFLRLPAEVLKQSDAAFVELEVRGILHAAQKIQIGHGEPAPCIPGMPGDKDEVAVLYPAGRPFEIIVKMCGLVVFVDSEKRDVQIVAGIGEIIGIIAKERDVKFWSENQTHIGVLLVLV